MSGLRKDSKGRVLKNGEYQQSDGRYVYKYTDAGGVRHAVYSWRLVETDKIPSGKRDSVALRTIVKQIRRDLEDGILSDDACRKTLNELFDEFMMMRVDLKETTRCNYICLYDKHIRDDFGERTVGGIKYTDIKKLYLRLSNVDGLSISSIQAINSIIWQTLEMATRDSLIRINPAEGVMKEMIRKTHEEPKERHALTVEQQTRLVDYVLHHKRYKQYAIIFTVLLGTGMRIGELLGLRWCDIDFKSGIIHVTHALAYKDTENGGYEYRISEPKTKAGIRTIPMFRDVADALKKEKSKKRNPNQEQFCIGNYSDFVFLNSNGKVYTPAAVYDKIQFIVDSYNKTEEAKSWDEHREPVYIPKISPHIFRHTFCTRLCELDVNLKVVQNVMGHRNIRTTMDVYNEATNDARVSGFKAIDGMIKLA